MSTTVDESTEVDDFLAHFGVKGMKWGKRKAPKDGQVTRAVNKESAARDRLNAVKSTASANRKEVRSARREVNEARQVTKAAEFNSAGKQRLERSGGSKALANTKIVGRTVALGMLSNAAGNLAANALRNNKDAVAAIRVGQAAFGVINATIGIRDIVGVSIQPSKKK